MAVEIKVCDDNDSACNVLVSFAAIGTVGRDRSDTVYVRVTGGAIALRKMDARRECWVWSSEDWEWNELKFTPDPGLRARIIIERV